MIHLAIILVSLPPSGLGGGWTCIGPQPAEDAYEYVATHPYPGYQVMRDDDPDYAQTLPACLEMLRVIDSIPR